MQKDKLVLEDYETFSVRGKNRIVIFPNVPFWIAVTETGFKALEEMRKKVKSKFVCKFIFQLCGFIYATFIFKRFD